MLAKGSVSSLSKRLEPTEDRSHVLPQEHVDKYVTSQYLREWLGANAVEATNGNLFSSKLPQPPEPEKGNRLRGDWGGGTLLHSLPWGDSIALEQYIQSSSCLGIILKKKEEETVAIHYWGKNQWQAYCEVFSLFLA